MRIAIRHSSPSHLAPTIIRCKTNADGGFVHVSDEWRRATGKDPAQALGWKWLEAVHPEDRSRVEASLRLSLAQTTRVETPLRLIDAAGTSRPALLMGDPPSADGASGALIDLAIFASDETTRGEAEATTQDFDEVRRRADFYHEALRNISDGLSVFDREWRYIFVNDNILRRIGKTMEEMIGLRVWDAFPEAVGTEGYHLLHRAMRERVSVEYEYYAAPYATWVSDKAYPTRDGLVIVSRDVTARKRMEDALHASRNMLRAIYDGTYEYIGLLTTSGVLLDVNRAALEFIGGDINEVVGRFLWETKWWAHTPGNVAERLQGAISRAAQGEFIRYETSLHRANGEIRYFDFSLHHVRNEKGEVIYLVPEGRDITEKKLLEMALREKEDRRAFLLTLSDALRPYADPRDVAQEALRLLCEHVRPGAAFCLELDETRRNIRQRAAWFGPGPLTFDDAALRLFWQATTPMLQPREMIVVADAAKDPRLDESARAAALAAGVGAFVAAPLLRGDKVVGTLIAQHATPYQWSEGELALIGETSDRSGGEMERAEDQAAIRRSEEKQAFLLKLSDAMRPLTEANEIYAVGCRLLRERLGVSRVHYCDIEDGHYWVRGCALDGAPPFAPQGEIAAFGAELLAAYRRGETVACADTRRDPRFTEAERLTLASAQVVAFAKVTVFKRGEWIGAFGAHHCEPREWTESELELMRDVAERVASAAESARSEAALRDSEKRFRAVFESMDEGFILADVIFDEADQATEIVYLEINLAAKRMTGRMPAARRRRVCDAGREDDWFDLLERVARSGVSERLERYYQERKCWFDVYVFKFDALVSDRRVAVVFQDVTERKKSEVALRNYADMLQEGDRRKDEFLATLAHELRNPLAPIRNAVYLLRRLEGGPDLVEKSAALIDMVDRQVDHLVRLVDDLLEVSRISRGKIELHKTTINLADVVRHAVETSEPFIDKGRHRLTVELPEEALRFSADPVRLAQVFSNLLNNAAKYTPRGGLIRIVGRREDNEVVVSVIDNGVGVAPDMLPRVFDLFAQASDLKARAQGGLGIGLALVRNLVQLHGGSVTAASAGEGRGSEFTVRLPLARPLDAKPDDRKAPAAAAPRRALVIDDNRDAADTLAMVLQALGAQTLVAYDGHDGVAVFADFHPDLVLLDLGMEGLDGYETARRLRSLPGGSRATLVALTGWGQAADRNRTQEAGFDAHLTKPASILSLDELLRRRQPA